MDPNTFKNALTKKEPRPAGKANINRCMSASAATAVHYTGR